LQPGDRFATADRERQQELPRQAIVASLESVAGGVEAAGRLSDAADSPRPLEREEWDGPRGAPSRGHAAEGRDMKSELVEAWRMSHECNLLFLREIPEAWLSDRYASRTRSVAEQFIHLHDVRLRWLEHSAPRAAHVLDSIPRDSTVTRGSLRRALTESARSVADFLAVCESEGKVKGWNGAPATFLGYLIAHEAHHRGLAMVALRACGRMTNPRLVYGLWDWGKKSRRR